VHPDRYHRLDVGSFAMNREDIIQEMIRSEEQYKQSLADLKAFEFKMAVIMIISGSFMLGGSISFLLYKVMQ
jgi:UDP-3-O-acyl-N-acetylglucosamine deacetylase